MLEGGLAPRATICLGEVNEVVLKRKWAMIMAPGNTNYFDTTRNCRMGHGDLLFTSVEDVYGYEPIPAALSQEEAKLVLGAQGNVWTEYIRTEKVEYMAILELLPYQKYSGQTLAKDWYSF